MERSAIEDRGDLTPGIAHGHDRPGIRYASSGLQRRGIFVRSPQAPRHGGYRGTIAPDCAALHPGSTKAFASTMNETRATNIGSLIA